MKSYDKDPKPIGLSATEITNLDYEWKLILKDKGFKDIEYWDNRRNGKTQEIRFYGGHLRVKGRDFKDIAVEHEEGFEFFRIIGYIAHNCPGLILDKYVELLKDYAMTGNMSLSVRRVNPKLNTNLASAYVQRNFPRFLAEMGMEDFCYNRDEAENLRLAEIKKRRNGKTND